MQKEIIWNNEEWIIDYGRSVFYKKEPVKSEAANATFIASIKVPFREFKGVVYFKSGNDFCKIVDDKVTIMSNEEADRIIDEMNRLKKLSINNDKDIRYIHSIISSILIEEILSKKHNVTARLKDASGAGKFPTLVQQFEHKFPHVVDMRINDISKYIIGVLPGYVEKATLKEQVKKTLDTMFEQNTSYLDNMMNQIYEENKSNFEACAEAIKRCQDRKPTIIPVQSLPFDDKPKTM